MLHRPALPPYPRERLSPAALATSAALHAGLLWLLLQYTPLVPAVRYVVYQYVRPISPSANVSRAITLHPPNRTPAADMSVFSNAPKSSIPMQATRKLPETRQARHPAPTPPSPEPEPEPVPEAAQPEPSVPAPPDVAPAVPVPVPPLPVPQPPPAPAPVPLEPPAPVPEPAPQALPAAEPAPSPAPAPPPVPEPVPEPAPQPAPEPAPEPVTAPPEPAPTPAPAPAPAEPTAPPAPAPAPAPAPTTRLQGPVIDVPVAPGSPAAANATPITVPAPPGWGGPTVAAPAAPTRPALPPAPVLMPPGLSPIPGPYRSPPRRSLAERANDQLRRDQPDPFAQDVEQAGRDDCLHAPKEGELNLGLLNAPVLAAKALAGKCAK